MTSTERKIFELISSEGKVSIFKVAQKMGISTDYTYLICQGLKRHSHIDISGNYCSICKPKEKLIKKEGEISRKISQKREKHGKYLFFNLKTVSKKTAEILKGAGYKSIEDIAYTPFSIFIQKTGIELSQAAKIFNEARKKIGKIL